MPVAAAVLLAGSDPAAARQTVASIGFYIAIYLANNEYGLCFVIPDAPWVNGELREVIEDNLDP